MLVLIFALFACLNCCRSKSWERRKEEDHRERRDEMNMTQVEMMMTIMITVMRMMIDHDDGDDDDNSKDMRFNPIFFSLYFFHCQVWRSQVDQYHR